MISSAPPAIAAFFMNIKFWGIADPQVAQLQRVMFMKNAAIAGGALLIMYWGSGPYSLDS